MLKNSNMEMEEKIYQLLSEKLGKTSLSERTIKSKAARLAKKVTKEDEIYMLEINTTPGMTATSFIPQQIRAAKLEIGDVMTDIIENSINKLS